MDIGQKSPSPMTISLLTIHIRYRGNYGGSLTAAKGQV